MVSKSLTVSLETRTSASTTASTSTLTPLTSPASLLLLLTLTEAERLTLPLLTSATSFRVLRASSLLSVRVRVWVVLRLRGDVR